MTTKKEFTNLEDWFQEFGDRYMCCWSKGNEISKYFAYNEFEIEIETLRDTGEFDNFGYRILEPYIEIAPIENFAYNESDSSCSFSIGSSSYQLYFVDEPQDKWGNTATYQGGVDFNSDCIEIYYSDTTVFELYNLEYPKFIEDGELESEFDSWFQCNSLDYDFISEITNNDICGGTWSGFVYGTTNKSFDSEEWQELFTDFKTYWES